MQITIYHARDAKSEIPSRSQAWITSLRYQRLSLLDARQYRKNRKVSDNERRILQQQRIRLMTDFQLGKLNLDLVRCFLAIRSGRLLRRE